MSLKFGGTSQEYYMKNYDKIELHPSSRLQLERILGVITGEEYCCEVTWKESCKRRNITLEQDLRAKELYKELG